MSSQRPVFYVLFFTTLVYLVVSSPFKRAKHGTDSIKEYNWFKTKYNLNEDNDVFKNIHGIHNQYDSSKSLQNGRNNETFSNSEKSQGKHYGVIYNYTEDTVKTPRKISIVKSLKIDIENYERTEATTAERTTTTITLPSIAKNFSTSEVKNVPQNLTKCGEGQMLLDNECKRFSKDNIIKTPSVRRRCDAGKKLDIFGQCKESW